MQLDEVCLECCELFLDSQDTDRCEDCGQVFHSECSKAHDFSCPLADTDEDEDEED